MASIFHDIKGKTVTHINVITNGPSTKKSAIGTGKPYCKGIVFHCKLCEWYPTCTYNQLG